MSFGAFLIFGNLVSKKLLVVQQNGLKFGTRTLVTNIWGTFDLVVFNEDHFVIIRCICLKRACNSKISGCRTKRTEILGSGTLVTHIGTGYI